MKVLALVVDSRMPNNDAMLKSMQEHMDVDVVKVHSLGHKNLRKFLRDYDLGEYDRVFMDLHFKRIVKQARFISSIQNLVIYEEDACQNYLPDSKWKGEFLRFYKRLGQFRLVCTSATTSEKFKKEGVDACFLAKAYDESQLKNLEIERDIELGFIGRVESNVYAERLQLLTAIREEKNLQLLRTAPGEDYLRMLNRIKIFISADIGFGEYMIKNFEAMACGCLLVAYKQGLEEEALGLKDMDNICLYKDKKELLVKIDWLMKNPEKALEISKAGELKVKESFTYKVMAKKLSVILQKDFIASPKKSLFSRVAIKIKLLK